MNRRLYRSRSDSMIGGVAAGLAAYLNSDPALVRIVWAILVVLTGGLAFRSSDQRRVDGAANSIFVLGPGGKFVGRYDKAHLVPYGEYLPFRPLLSAIGLSRLAPGDLDFQPLFDALSKMNYSGWVIVEAEQDPAVADPRAFARIGLGTLRDKARLARLEAAK